MKECVDPGSNKTLASWSHKQIAYLLLQCLPLQLLHLSWHTHVPLLVDAIVAVAFVVLASIDPALVA